MENNKNFFEWYKRKITENPQDPPANVWQNIADELDTNDVWDKVAARLDNRGGWYFQKPWNYALPALLLLLISGGAYFYHHNAFRMTPAATAQVYADTDDGSASKSVVTEDGSVDSTTKEEAVVDAKPPRDVKITEVPEKNVTWDKNKVDAGEEYDSDGRVTQGKASSSSTTKIITEDDTSVATESVKEKVPRGTTTAGTKKIFLREAKSSTEKAQTNQTQSAHIAVDTAPRSADRDNAEQKMVVENSWRDNDDAIASEANDNNHNNDHALPPETSEDDSTGIIIRQSQTNITARYDTAARHSALPAGDKSATLASSTQRPRYSTMTVARITVPDSMLSISPVVALIQPDPLAATKAMPPVDPPVFSRSLEFGISGSVKNTWLLNQTTFTGLERRSLTATLPDFGKDIGVAIRYNFAPRFTVQAEGFFISDMGQRYNEYRKGKYIEREVDLNYFHGNLLFKYGNNAMQLGRLVNGHGIIGGLYLSKLISAAETIDAHTTDMRDDYAKADYGVIIGYEYNQHLFSNFFFTSGVRLNYGLKDIRPDASSRTSTGSFDVNFSLRYRVRGF